MKTSHEKFSDSLIISRLQQIEIASLKPSPTVDSPFFNLVTVAAQKPFFDNLPFHVGMEFRLIGSKILGVNITRGYFCHDLEQSLSSLPPYDALFAIARLRLSSPIFYQAALFIAYMRLAEQNLSTKQTQFFTWAMEFSRVAHHLFVIKNVLHCLKLSLVEIVEDCEEILRPAFLLFNRLRTPEDPPMAPLTVTEVSDIIFDALARVEELAVAIGLEEKIRLMLQKKAVVSLTQAGSLGLTGSYLRANQDLYDLRRQSEQSVPYGKPPRSAIGEGGDAWTRFSLRSQEIVASLKWLKQNLLQSDRSISSLEALVIDENFGTINPRRPFAAGEVEGPEGDIKVSIFMKPDGTPLFRIRSPAYFIGQAITHMLSHVDLKDVAILLFALGITAEEIDM